jgi:arylsulfatase A-like enzyme
MIHLGRFSSWLLSVVCLLSGASPAHADDRPNILLILADDLGYSDIGCYGGEIETPHLDALAAGGLRYTQFYNTARCWPTRAAILTGYYAQSIRRDAVDGKGGSQGQRPAWAPLITEPLRQAGYRCYQSGKWHIDGLPSDNAFDHSFRIEDHDRYHSPRSLYRDDIPLAPIPRGTGYYVTTAIASHTVDVLKDHARDRNGTPFFHYLAFTSPHFPLHALPEDIARYKGRFNSGWDELRQARHERMTRMGLVKTALSPRTDGVSAWADLSSADRAEWVHRMEVHAAMVDRMDREIGRVVEQLKAMGAYDNTLILFLSDNGASAERILRGDGHVEGSAPGSADWYRCLEPGWANLANTPFRFSKIYVHEGGISTPFIVHWPARIKAAGEIRHHLGHVIDMAPSLASLAGTTWAAERGGEKVPEKEGRDLSPLWLGPTAKSDEHGPLWWYHSGNRAYRDGDWKLVAVAPEKPRGQGTPKGNASVTWELYNLADDRAESRNLAAEHPDKVAAMAAAWEQQLQRSAALAGQ